MIRASPYPPNFRRIAANTIEPAIGASTWALGSHKWTENIGSFTRNPRMASVQNRGLALINEGSIISVHVAKDALLDVLKIKQKIMNIGSEAVIVYIIKYILACSRSGWYPHVIIISMVGMRDASNQM
jgi:hypothetical protein